MCLKTRLIQSFAVTPGKKCSTDGLTRFRSLFPISRLNTQIKRLFSGIFFSDSTEGWKKRGKLSCLFSVFDSVFDFHFTLNVNFNTSVMRCDDDNDNV